MFTLIGYYEEIAALEVLTLINGIADQHVRVADDDIYIPELDHIAGVISNGFSMTDIQLRSPSLRRLALYDVSPLGNELTPAGSAHGDFRPYSPIALEKNEVLNVAIAHTAVHPALVVVILSDGAITPVTGEIFTVKATSAIAGVAGTWEAGVLNIVQTLPVGRYQVVGMAPSGNAVVAARLVFIGYQWRPGAPAVQAIGRSEAKEFRYGNFGVFGEFDHITPPSAEILCVAGSITQEYYLDLIKVA